MIESPYVLITGAAKRIGRVFALSAAKSGFNVIIHYRNSSDEAYKVAQQIKEIGKKALVVQADLENPAEVSTLFEKLPQDIEVQVLINSAAIFEDLRWDTTTLEQWNRHLMVNLTAPFLLSQSYAKRVGEKEGQIINILDWKTERPGNDHLPYIISKVALSGLTKSLAVSLAPNIRVNGLALGAVLPAVDTTTSETITQSIPLKRWAATEELEDTFSFLLLKATYLNGEILTVDGGRHLI
jgi:NAD(P)-dependent dehydrogenase (short-subunit alcohol dehydrogenase family)